MHRDRSCGEMKVAPPQRRQFHRPSPGMQRRYQQRAIAQPVGRLARHRGETGRHAHQIKRTSLRVGLLHMPPFEALERMGTAQPQQPLAKHIRCRSC